MSSISKIQNSIISASAFAGAAVVLTGCGKGSDCQSLKEKDSCQNQQDCFWFSANTNSTDAGVCVDTSFASCDEIASSEVCNKNQWCTWQDKDKKCIFMLPTPAPPNCLWYDPNCETCNAETCLSCKSGFTLDGSQCKAPTNCLFFDPHCVTCNSDKCLTCDENFTLEDNQCIASSKPTTGSK